MWAKFPSHPYVNCLFPCTNFHATPSCMPVTKFNDMCQKIRKLRSHSCTPVQ